MEDVKVREMQIFDYKKKIAEAETKLKQQQNLYEAVRSDRNLYSKNLIESQVGLRSGTRGMIVTYQNWRYMVPSTAFVDQLYKFCF
jgi:hypothetical protein